MSSRDDDAFAPGQNGAAVTSCAPNVHCVSGVDSSKLSATERTRQKVEGLPSGPILWADSLPPQGERRGQGKTLDEKRDDRIGQQGGTTLPVSYLYCGQRRSRPAHISVEGAKNAVVATVANSQRGQQGPTASGQDLVGTEQPLSLPISDPTPDLPIPLTRVRNCTVLREHELKIGDVVLRESQEMCDQTTADSSILLRTVTIHTRAIGDRIHQLKHTARPDFPALITVNTTMNEEEIAQFEEDWALLWRPAVTPERLDNLDSLALDFRTEDEALSSGELQ